MDKTNRSPNAKILVKTAENQKVNSGFPPVDSSISANSSVRYPEG